MCRSAYQDIGQRGEQHASSNSVPDVHPGIMSLLANECTSLAAQDTIQAC